MSAIDNAALIGRIIDFAGPVQQRTGMHFSLEADYGDVRAFLIEEGHGDPAKLYGVLFPVGYEGDWHRDGYSRSVVYYPADHPTPLCVKTSEHACETFYPERGRLLEFNSKREHRIGLVEHEPRYCVVARYSL